MTIIVVNTFHYDRKAQFTRGNKRVVSDDKQRKPLKEPELRQYADEVEEPGTTRSGVLIDPLLHVDEQPWSYGNTKEKRVVGDATHPEAPIETPPEAQELIDRTNTGRTLPSAVHMPDGPIAAQTINPGLPEVQTTPNPHILEKVQSDPILSSDVKHMMTSAVPTVLKSVELSKDMNPNSNGFHVVYDPELKWTVVAVGSKHIQSGVGLYELGSQGDYINIVVYNNNDMMKGLSPPKETDVSGDFAQVTQNTPIPFNNDVMG